MKNRDLFLSAVKTEEFKLKFVLLFKAKTRTEMMLDNNSGWNVENVRKGLDEMDLEKLYDKVVSPDDEDYGHFEESVVGLFSQDAEMIDLFDFLYARFDNAFVDELDND